MRNGITQFIFISLLILGLSFVSPPAAAQSFDCIKAATPVEKTICADAHLKALDVHMAALYRQSLSRASTANQKTLKYEQVRWLKSRDHCSQASDLRACLNTEYNSRIARLNEFAQGEAPVSQEFTFSCDDGSKLIVSYPNSGQALVQRISPVMALPQAKSGSGARYANKEVVYWNKGDEATFEVNDKTYSCKRP